MADVEFQMMQLVHLAIGTPETGAVNFNLLQKLLTEMLQLTDLSSAKVKLTATELANIGESQAVKIPEPEPEGAAAEGRGSKRIIGCGLSPEKAEDLLVSVNQLKMDYDDLKAKVEQVASVKETVPFQEVRASVSKIDGIQEKMARLEGMVDQFKDLNLGDDMPLGQRLIQMQKLVDAHEDQLAKVNNVMGEKLEYLEKEIKTMETDLGEMNEKLNLQKLGAKKSAMGEKDSKISMVAIQDQTANINNLISRLSSVQHDLDNLTMMTASLNEESDHKQMLIDALTEQIEMLKLAKADKTNMEDILAAKADMSQVHRKVSHDQFETKMEQLNTALDDAFNRLESQEETWQEEVEELKVDIQNKLDKIEFAPLKDYVNEKLKMLQDKMKALAAQKREGMAAGSKRRILRDVQCISCDNESVMKTDNTFEEMMPPPPLPMQPSVKPYLTYKLDQVRKQQKKLPTGRNLLHFEEMLQNPGGFRRGSGEQIVNRFVGGSHTTTTPQQRITRTGNFFETWGPIITAVDTSQPQTTQAHSTTQAQSVSQAHSTQGAPGTVNQSPQAPSATVNQSILRTSIPQVRGVTQVTQRLSVDASSRTGAPSRRLSAEAPSRMATVGSQGAQSSQVAQKASGEAVESTATVGSQGTHTSQAAQKTSLESASRAATTAPKKSTESANRAATQVAPKSSTESANRAATQAAQKSSTESANRGATQIVQKSSAESANRAATEAAQKSSAESANRAATEAPHTSLTEASPSTE